MTRTPAPFTRAGLLLGARMSLPLWPGICVFGIGYGAAAVARGVTSAEAVATSAFVYAGAAQMVGLELWRRPWDLSTLLGVMTVTFFVNARMILAGATLQPWVAGGPAWRNAVNHFFLVDANWIIGMRYREEGGRDLGVLLGAGLTMWPVWVAATGIGCAAGAFVARPRDYGLDLIMPVFFAAMLVPLWRGPRPARPWAIAAVAALAAQRLLPGYAFVVVGALAGFAAGMLLDEADPPLGTDPGGTPR